MKDTNLVTKVAGDRRASCNEVLSRHPSQTLQFIFSVRASDIGRNCIEELLLDGYIPGRQHGAAGHGCGAEEALVVPAIRDHVRGD